MEQWAKREEPTVEEIAKLVPRMKASSLELAEAAKNPQPSHLLLKSSIRMDGFTQPTQRLMRSGLTGLAPSRLEEGRSLERLLRSIGKAAKAEMKLGSAMTTT